MNEEAAKERKRALAREWAAKWRRENPELAREKDRIKNKLRRAVNGEHMRAYCRARYAANREKIRERAKIRYAENIGGMREKARADYHRKYAEGRIIDRLRSALNAAKARAKERGIEFDLKISDLGEPTHCAVTGIEFDMSKSFRKGNIFVPSIDRIDPALGYVKSNVRVVCHGYNLAKHTGTDADVVKLARAIVAMVDA